MPIAKLDPQWLERLCRVEFKVDEIVFPNPDVHQNEIPQDEEWCEVVVGDGRRRIRFHDYDEIYRIPGLYEELFYERLKCCSPSMIAHLLEEVLNDFDDNVQQLRVLDLGAGNGMVGDELYARHAQRIVGIDVLPEAREATYRDRPEVYDDYMVVDLTDLPRDDEKALRNVRFNCLTSVAALGFGDVPPKAFLRALTLIQNPSWVAFTIKDDFFRERETTGFSRLIRTLSREEILQIQAYRRFRHRLSITGTPLYYIAMVARKLEDIPPELLEANWQAED